MQGNLWLHCNVQLERSFPENSVYGHKSETLAAGYVLNNKPIEFRVSNEETKEIKIENEKIKKVQKVLPKTGF